MITRFHYISQASGKTKWSPKSKMLRLWALSQCLLESAGFNILRKLTPQNTSQAADIIFKNIRFMLQIIFSKTFEKKYLEASHETDSKTCMYLRLCIINITLKQLNATVATACLSYFYQWILNEFSLAIKRNGWYFSLMKYGLLESDSFLSPILR